MGKIGRFRQDAGKRGETMNIKMIYAVVLIGVVQSCGPSPKERLLIDSVPPPNDNAIGKIQDYRDWHNPFIMVYAEGYALEQPQKDMMLNLDELETALLRLPLNSWALGKVVAVQPNAISPKEPQQTDNFFALRKMLQSHGIRDEDWPPA
jgi:hypothetical protein